MADIDLRLLDNDEFVLHFGGRPNEVDAFTFSNALISIGEALREINRQISPELNIEVAIEGVGPGSFRTKLKTTIKSLSGLFKGDGRSLIIGILAAVIYDKAVQPLMGPPVAPTIIVSDDSVIVSYGVDRIIVPRSVYDAKQTLLQPQQINRHVSKAFSVLEDDPSVTDFGLMRRIDDHSPIATIQRSEFAHLAEELETIDPPDDRRRHQDERTKLIVIKAILERSNRQWQFVWNGIRISAPIKDEGFFARLQKREFSFAQGDILDATLRIHQLRDPANGVFINERYEIIEVFGKDPRPIQGNLL